MKQGCGKPQTSRQSNPCGGGRQGPRLVCHRGPPDTQGAGAARGSRVTVGHKLKTEDGRLRTNETG